MIQENRIHRIGAIVTSVLLFLIQGFMVVFSSFSQIVSVSQYPPDAFVEFMQFLFNQLLLYLPVTIHSFLLLLLIVALVLGKKNLFSGIVFAALALYYIPDMVWTPIRGLFFGGIAWYEICNTLLTWISGLFPIVFFTLFAICCFSGGKFPGHKNSWILLVAAVIYGISIPVMSFIETFALNQLQMLLYGISYKILTALIIALTTALMSGLSAIPMICLGITFWLPVKAHQIEAPEQEV